MVFRPDQHQVGARALPKFEIALPKQWIVRRKPDDYGIDLEVQVVNSDNRVSGEVFLVQVKATGSDKDDIIKRVSLELDTLQLYREHELPVMLVRYSEHTDKLYFKWVNNVDQHYAKEDAKSMSIRFSEEDEITTETPEKILKYLEKYALINSGRIPQPVQATIIVEESIIADQGRLTTQAKLTSKCSEYQSVVEIVGDVNDSFIQCNINQNAVEVKALDLFGFVFHNFDPDEHDDPISALCRSLFIGIASVYLQAHQFDSCSRVLYETNLMQYVLSRPDTMSFFSLAS